MVFENYIKILSTHRAKISKFINLGIFSDSLVFKATWYLGYSLHISYSL